MCVCLSHSDLRHQDSVGSLGLVQQTVQMLHAAGGSTELLSQLLFTGLHVPDSRLYTHTHTQTHRHTDTHRDTHTETHRQRHTDTHTDRDRQTHRQTDTHTDRHTHRHTDRQTDRQTEKDSCLILFYYFL